MVKKQVKILVDNWTTLCYTTLMKKFEINDVLQWTGAPLVIAGHSLNAIGPSVYPWNIVVFFWGTACFFAWSIRTRNRPQTLVNAISLTIGLTGIYKAFLG